MTPRRYQLLYTILGWVPVVAFLTMFLFQSAWAAAIYVTLAVCISGGLRGVIAPYTRELQ